MELSQLQQIVESNARAIAALTDNVSKVSVSLDTLSRQMIDFQRSINRVERRMDDTLDEIRDIRADIRELQMENNRILNYLERK